MSQLRLMLKQGSIYTALNILRRSISFIMVPLYTRYLLPAEYGLLELVEVTANVFDMFASAGIGAAVFKFYNNYPDARDRARVLSSGIIGSTILYSLFGLGGILSARLLSTMVFGNPEYSIYFILFFLRFFIIGGTTIATDSLRLFNRPVFYSVVLLLQFLLAAGLNVLCLVFFKMGARGMLIGTLVAQFVMGSFVLIWVLRKCGLSFDFRLLRPMLGYGLPLIMGSLGHFMINFANRYFLQASANLADVGIFSLGYRLAFMIHFLLVGPFILMWQGKMFEVAQKPEAKKIFQKTFTYFLLLISLGAAVLSLFSHEIVALMADTAYYHAFLVIPWIAFAFALNGCQIYFQLGMLLKNKTSYLGIATLILGLFSLPLFYLFIKFWGLYGAAIAMTIVYSLFALVNYVLSQKFYPLQLEIKRLLIIVLMCLSLIFLAHFIVAERLWVSLLMKLMLCIAMLVTLWFSGFLNEAERQIMTQFLKPRVAKIMRRRNAIQN